jgi:Polysulphide reductase, NrfD
VLTLAIPIRAAFDLEDFITMRHLQNMAKVMLVTGLIVAYGYMTEAFIAWYSGDQYEGFVPMNRLFGPYAVFYWTLILCNVVIPQLLWWRRIRTSVPALFIVSIIVNVGMWLERFVIIVLSLHRDFLPSSWGMYAPTFWDWSTFLGTIGLFVSLLFLFVRFLPMISIAEMRSMLPEAKVDEDLRGI